MAAFSYHDAHRARTGKRPLSSLFRDPALRRAFERVERDNGTAFAVPTPKPAPVKGGAAKELIDA